MYTSITRFFRPVITDYLEAGEGLIEGLPHYIIDRRFSIPGLYTFIQDPNVVVIARAASESLYHTLLQDKECAKCKIIPLKPLDVLDYDIMPTSVDKYGIPLNSTIKNILSTEVNVTVFDALVPANDVDVDRGCLAYIQAKKQYPQYSWNHYDSLMVYSGIENYVNFKGRHKNSCVRYIPLSDFAFVFDRGFPPYYHDEIGQMIKIDTDINYVERIYQMCAFRQKPDNVEFKDPYTFKFKAFSGYEVVMDTHGGYAGYIPLQTVDSVLGTRAEVSDYNGGIIITLKKPYKNVERIDKSFDPTKYDSGREGGAWHKYYCNSAGNICNLWRTQDPSYYSNTILGYFYNRGIHAAHGGNDFSLTSFCRDIGGGIYVTWDNIRLVAGLFCAACSGAISRSNWVRRAYRKSLPPDNSYLEDNDFCTNCIVYMILSPYNRTKSYWLPTLHRNQLSLDGIGCPMEIFLRDQMHWHPNDAPYHQAVAEHYNCLNMLDRFEEYDSDFTYTWWQMNADVNTFHGAPRWDEDNSNHPDLSAALINAQAYADNFLFDEILPKLLKYGFLT